MAGAAIKEQDWTNHFVKMSKSLDEDQSEIDKPVRVSEPEARIVSGEGASRRGASSRRRRRRAAPKRKIKRKARPASAQSRKRKRSSNNKASKTPSKKRKNAHF